MVWLSVGFVLVGWLVVWMDFVSWFERVVELDDLVVLCAVKIGIMEIWFVIVSVFESLFSIYWVCEIWCGLKMY